MLLYLLLFAGVSNALTAVIMVLILLLLLILQIIQSWLIMMTDMIETATEMMGTIILIAGIDHVKCQR